MNGIFLALFLDKLGSFLSRCGDDGLGCLFGFRFVLKWLSKYVGRSHGESQVGRGISVGGTEM